MKILVLDDHKAFREEIRNILQKNGHEADAIATAPEAVPLAESGKYDFVLVDYRMPHHDGIWFMENVKLPKRTKALLVTAYTDKGVLTNMFSTGVCGYIIKPFDEEDLLHHLDFHSSSK